MSKTRNIAAKPSRKDMKSDIVKLVTKYGESQTDNRIRLNVNAIGELKKEVRSLYRILSEIEEIGGYVVVQEGISQKTVYRLDSYSWKKSRKG